MADESLAGNSNEDESLIFTDDDVTAFLGDRPLLRGELDAVAKPAQNDGESETIYTQSSESDEPVGEELSISLFDENDTSTVAEAAKRAEASSEEIELDLELEPQNDSTQSLNLVAVPDKDGAEVEVGSFF